MSVTRNGRNKIAYRKDYSILTNRERKRAGERKE